MSDVHIPKIRNLTELVRGTISAHQAVREGIATHAEKERAKRQERYHKLEAEHNLHAQQKGMT